MTVYSYFTLRVIADIFPLAVIVLLDTAILIATRDPVSSRGDVGHQLAWASLGWAIFAPIVSIDFFDNATDYFIPFIVGIILIVLSALILLFSR